MPSGTANNIARSRPSSMEIRPINTAPMTNSDKDVLQPPLKVAPVEDLHQEEHEAADQRHNQRRTDGDDKVIDQGRLAETVCHRNTYSRHKVGSVSFNVLQVSGFDSFGSQLGRCRARTPYRRTGSRLP